MSAVCSFHCSGQLHVALAIADNKPAAAFRCLIKICCCAVQPTDDSFCCCCCCSSGQIDANILNYVCPAQVVDNHRQLSVDSQRMLEVTLQIKLLALCSLNQPITCESGLSERKVVESESSISLFGDFGLQTTTEKRQ